MRCGWRSWRSWLLLRQLRVVVVRLGDVVGAGGGVFLGLGVAPLPVIRLLMIGESETDDLGRGVLGGLLRGTVLRGTRGLPVVLHARVLTGGGVGVLRRRPARCGPVGRRRGATVTGTRCGRRRRGGRSLGGVPVSLLRGLALRGQFRLPPGACLTG